MSKHNEVLDVKPCKMKTEVTKTLYDGQKFNELGSFPSLEIAHGGHSEYCSQQTFEDIEKMGKSVPYLHLMEFRNGEHYNDLYFIWPSKNRL